MSAVVYLSPWKNFDPEIDSAVGQAVELISERLADGEWHGIREMVAEIATDTQLEQATIRNLINGMALYGDAVRKSFVRRGGYQKVRIAGRYL